MGGRANSYLVFDSFLKIPVKALCSPVIFQILEANLNLRW